MNKKRIVVLSIIVILFISIGYAYLSANLDVLGIANVKKVKWNIFLSNLEVTKGKEFEVLSPVITGTKTTSIDYKVVLENPGDIYSLDIDVVNDGTIDAMISLVNNSELTEEQQKFTRYSVTYKDGTPIQEKNFLGSYSRDTFTVSLEFRNDIEIEDLPGSDNEIALNLSLEYIQAKESDNRENKNILVKDLSGNNNNAIIYGAKINNDGTVTTDGVDDYIDCGLSNYDFGNSMSYVIKLKFNSFDYFDLFGNWHVAGSGVSVQSKRVYSSYYIDGKYYTYHGSNTVQTNSWYTIVSTYDGEKIKMYLNGESLVPTENPTGSEVFVSGNIKKTNLPILIGGNPEPNADPIHLANIIVSKALVFDRALSEEEVARDYGVEINPTDYTDMLFYYDFSK